MSDERIILATDVGVATITLNRPEVGNALDLPTAQELARVVDRCIADPCVRCVVLTGTGRLFCAGGDVAAMAKAGDDGRVDMLGELIAALHEVLEALMEMPKPFVTLVNGPAAGAGFSLAISGDVVIAAEAASFLAAYGAIGLTADGGMSWLLPRLVGLREAQRIVLLNEKVGSAEALQLGLVSQVVPAGDLAEAGRTMAARLAGGAMSSLGGSRRLLRQSFQSSYADQLARERLSMMEAARGPENSEGVAAFLAKRQPDFTKAKK